MSKAKDPHLVRIVLRDWSKTKKANSPVIAETHSKNKGGK